MPSSPAAPFPPEQLGDYRPGPVVAESRTTVTFEAEQISVRRTVLLECVRPEFLADGKVVEAFLSDVRAKAALDFPVVSSVYEAVRTDAAVFYAREKPPGRPLAELHAAGDRLEPRVILLLLERLGEAHLYLSERLVRTRPLRPDDLYFEPPDVLRLDNLAVAGTLDESVRRLDRQTVSLLFSELIEPGLPAATRTGRLLDLLADEDSPNWASVAHTAGKLARALAEDARAEAPTAPLRSPPRRRRWGALAFTCATLLLVAAVIAGVAHLLERSRVTAVRPLGQMVHITGARALGPDGEVRPLPAFWIDAHEVTISEYEEFLRALALVAPDRRDAYDHPAQPPAKTGHVPDDWEALLRAAQTGGTWNGITVTPNCPVVNVDWWDAYAYAGWRGGRLPTQAEWFAAAESTTLEGSGWGPVDLSSSDRTPSGVQGLAGNVTEWIGELVRNPATPTAPPGPLSCGASHLEPENGALVRIWHPSRDTRRPDLGIRVLRETAP